MEQRATRALSARVFGAARALSVGAASSEGFVCESVWSSEQSSEGFERWSSEQRGLCLRGARGSEQRTAWVCQEQRGSVDVGAAWVGLREGLSSEQCGSLCEERRAARASLEAGGEQCGFLVLILQAQFFLDSGEGAGSLEASSARRVARVSPATTQFFSPVLVLSCRHRDSSSLAAARVQGP